MLDESEVCAVKSARTSREVARGMGKRRFEMYFLAAYTARCRGLWPLMEATPPKL